MQISSPTFSSLVQEATAFPEVRDQVVAAYKSQIASGQYPSAEVVSALADRLTGSLD